MDQPGELREAERYEPTLGPSAAVNEYRAEHSGFIKGKTALGEEGRC